MKVKSSHALMFVRSASDAAKASLAPLFDGGVFHLKPTDKPVDIPAWVAKEGSFQAARASGWVVVDSSEEDAQAHDASVLTGVSDEDLFAEFWRRMMVKDGFEDRARAFFAEQPEAGDKDDSGTDGGEDGRLDPGEDDPMKKSSGIDGDAGAWTEMGEDEKGYPVPKGSPEDVKATPAEKGAYTKAKKAADAAAAGGKPPAKV